MTATTKQRASDATNDRQTSERERLADDLERFGHSSTDCDESVWKAADQLRAADAEIERLRAEVATSKRAYAHLWQNAINTERELADLRDRFEKAPVIEGARRGRLTFSEADDAICKLCEVLAHGRVRLVRED